MKLISVYNDSKVPEAALKSGHGLCFLIYWKGRKILFDTGEDSNKVVENLKIILESGSQIDGIVFSHSHPDHIGGVFRILNEFPVKKAFVPYCFPKEFNRRLKNTGIKVHKTGKKPVEVFPGMQTTTLQKRIFSFPEQFLTINIKGGILLLSGCGHGGIVNILRKVKKQSKRKVRVLAGGFHFYCLPAFMIKRRVKQIEKEGVEKVAPCHCCGRQAVEIFKKSFPKIIDMRTGAREKFENN